MTVALEKAILSTVTPVYSGAAFLDQLVAELGEIRDELRRGGAPVELAEAVFVDDGSSDGSAALLAELANGKPWIRVVTLSRNFGQHPATVAGILHTSGHWVATLDEDLQHRPRHLIPLLRRAVEEAADLVYAHPEARVHGDRLRDNSSLLYKHFMSWLAGNPEVKKFNSFRMVRGSIARAAAAVASRETYFDIALCWFTRRVVTLDLPLRDIRWATSRRSGYGGRALLRHARRMLVSSQVKPLRLGGAVGFACLALSVLGSVIAILLKLLQPELVEVRGWTSLILVAFFFGGLIALLVGIALEYLSDLHLQALGRPTFFVVDRSRDQAIAAWFRR